MEKLLKTVESLKLPAFSIGTDATVQGSITSAVVSASDAVKTKKKERIGHCVAVTDSVLNQSVQKLPEFAKILESVTEVLFQLCNDLDSDIRLVVVDCLNRIVRTLRGTLLNRFQLEVYREIKKNQAPRSLRTALAIFATMSADIRPNRCRGFIQNLLPSLVQISKRTEELLYENLATSLIQILKNLGLFLTDADVKLLCKEYLKNLDSNSTVVRRSSAQILVYVCQYSRKPNIFLPNLLLQVTELLIPNIMGTNVSTIIGALLCMRQCLLPLYAELEKQFSGISCKEPVFRNIIQIYEICLILCNHDDHNVITTSLETLHQLLFCPVFEIARRLTSSEGIQNSLDSDQWMPKCQDGTPILPGQNPSQSRSFESEVSDSDTDAPILFLDSELEFRSELSSTASDARDEVEDNVVFSGSRRDSDVFLMASTSETEAGSQYSLEVHSEEETEKLNRLNNIELETFPELHIGSLYERNVPLFYCTRFLAYNFLLAGKKGFERSDSEVRVTVKVLAINCITNSIQLLPLVYNLPLALTEPDSEDVESVQKISDVSLYSTHHDPLLRGSTYVLIGHFINRILRMNPEIFENDHRSLEQLVSILNAGLLDKSNIGVKFALSGLTECLLAILRSKDGTSLIHNLFENIFAISSNPYWLVKVNLAELFAEMEWDSVPEYSQIQSRTLNLFLHMLSDEDVRVRSSAVSALIKFIQACGSRHDWINGNLTSLSSRSVIDTISSDMLKVPEKTHFNPNVSIYLEKVLVKIIPELEGLDDKHTIVSFYSALSSLAEAFPPTVYRGAWRCGGSELPFLFCVTVELLRSSPMLSDLYIHQNLLSLTSSLFLGLMNLNSDPVPEESSPFTSNHQNMSFYGLYLLHHNYCMVKLYNTLLSSMVEMRGFVEKKQSPVMSPAKKFLNKDSEKKAPETDKKGKQQSTGFANAVPVCPVQLKRIENSLHQSWKIYKSNLDPVVTHKFTSVLVTSLESLGSIFSWTRYDCAGLTTVVEDILAMAPVIFQLTPVPALRCMKHLLRWLNSSSPPTLIGEQTFPAFDNSLAHFESACQGFYKSIPAFRKLGVYPVSEKSYLGAHIRSFEPIVIAALKTYVTSSDSSVQAEILLFVSELIKGHVNYAMVDSNQVFLNAVIKQLTFLEDGQFRDSAIVIDAIFEYFSHLSHMDRPSKKFIEIPKMLQLCDGLVASEQNPAKNYIPAMKKIVYDLFIRQGSFGISNSEKKELEAQREVVFQNILKLLHVPDALSILFVLLQGRRGINEAKWSTECGLVGKALLDSLEAKTLLISSSFDLNALIALLYSIHAITFPSYNCLKNSLEKALGIQNSDPISLSQWMTTVNTLWVIILRTINQSEESVPSLLLLETLQKFVREAQNFFLWPSVSGGYGDGFFVDQLVLFLKVTTMLLSKDSSIQAVSELIQSEYIDEFSNMANQVQKISVAHPSVRKSYAEFLLALSYPHTAVWSITFSTERCQEAAEVFFSDFISTLTQNSVPKLSAALEEWLIQNYSNQIIEHQSLSVLTSFCGSISRSSNDLLMTKLTEMSTSPSLTVFRVKTVLRFMERVHERYRKTCAMICIRLLNRDLPISISFEISQFACFLYVQLQGELNLFSDEELDYLKQFVGMNSSSSRFPRLASLIRSFLCGTETMAENFDLESELNTSIEVDFKEGPISVWCCEEINPSEGAALAEILYGSTYSQVLSILNLQNFNLAILEYVFQHLHSKVLEEKIPFEDLVTLLTSEKHSNLIDKFPMSIATLDFVVEMLDKWEISIRDGGFLSPSQEVTSAILNISFRESLPHMWAVLTKILELKTTVLADISLQEKCLHNNYIPTSVFTFSFQYMSALCETMKPIPIHQLSVFLQFACTAIKDSSFMHFFNVRDHPNLIFSCILSLSSIMRGLISHFGMPYVLSETEDFWSDLSEECVHILNQFHFMLDVISQVGSGKLYLEPNLFELVKTLVAGLGRCELVNGWILISHLGWKPPVTNKAEIFPPILHIPLETLQNEKDLLLKFIWKLNFVQVSSKLQFEENWMTFLSVINSYGDEHYSLQIVVVGLQALSMMLEQAVKVVYVEDRSSHKSFNAMKKLNLVLKNLEPEIIQKHSLNLLYSNCKKTLENKFHVDVTSCIRFLIDLFSQWNLNSQGKMPLFLTSQVVESVINISRYFEETSQFVWMFEMLMEVYKGCEKEDEVLWSHLIYGIFVAASNHTIESESMAQLGQILESAMTSSSANVANSALESALTYFQNQPDAIPLLNIAIPYVINSTQLSETLSDTEYHSYNAWKLLLFIWIHCSENSAVGSRGIEQEVLGNILTVLSPLNKVHVSIRIMVLQSLRRRVEIGGLKAETKKMVSKVAMESLRTPNSAIFFESVKLFLTIFYCDFSEFYGVLDPDPEVLIQMAERLEIVFQWLRSGKKFSSRVASKVLPVIVMDFLPPSEVLNRVISQFLSPYQTHPELLAPTIAQIFEKARRKPQEAALVREWIFASLPNFVSSTDISRTVWNLTIFFVGVSSTPSVSCILPFAHLRRNPTQIKKLFIHSTLDYYASLTSSEKETFKSLISKGPLLSSSRNPYGFLLDLISRID